MTERFGEHVRRRRQECGLGLRETAKRAGISATFLSRVETNAEKALPSEEVIRKLASILNDDFDELMVLAGRISSEVKDYVKADPRMPEFLRRAKAQNIPAEKLMELLEKAKDKP
jgi:HTH-type transcriptional regulator, competence development regulator